MRPCKLTPNTRARPQECWESCTNGSNNVALRFSDHEFQRKFDRFQTLRKYSGPNNTRTQQHATGCANGRNM